MAKAECAPARYRLKAESCVLDFQQCTPGVVAIVDGAGSWGTGVEAAGWTRERLRARWIERCPRSTAQIVDDVQAAAASMPESVLKDNHGFSVVALLVSSGQIEGVAAGRFAAVRVSHGSLTTLFRPKTWVDEQVHAGNLSAEEALKHPLRMVCTGPHVTASHANLSTFGPIQIDPGDVVVLVELELFQHVLSMPSASWPKMSALQLQDLVESGKGMRAPVIKLFEDASAA